MLSQFSSPSPAKLSVMASRWPPCRGHFLCFKSRVCFPCHWTSLINKQNVVTPTSCTFKRWAGRSSFPLCSHSALLQGQTPSHEEAMPDGQACLDSPSPMSQPAEYHWLPFVWSHGGLSGSPACQLKPYRIGRTVCSWWERTNHCFQTPSSGVAYYTAIDNWKEFVFSTL